MILPDAMVQAGGWAILHSLWQGAVITLLLAFILGRSRHTSPSFRYYTSLGALLLLCGAVVATFIHYYQPASGHFSLTPPGGAPFLLEVAGPSPEVMGVTAGSGFSRFFPFLLQVWMIGVALMGIRMLAELFYLHRLRSVQTRPVPADWLERLNALKWRLDIVEPVLLRESMRINSPVLIGWLKPIILLPLGLLSSLSPAQVECILAHELAHVKRMDYLVNLLQSAIEVLLFFNPAVWWISAQIRQEREHCCDELAVAVTGDRIALVRTLAQLEEWRLQGGQLGLAFNGRPQGLLGRVQRLLDGESSTRIISRGLWSILFFCMLIGLLAFRSQAEETMTERIEENGGSQITEAVIDAREHHPAFMASLPHLTRGNETVRPRAKVGEQAALSTALGRSRSGPGGIAPLAKLEAIPALPTLSAPNWPVRDTIPEERIRQEMQAVQQEMERLQREMMKSPEMQQIHELTRKHEQEIRKLQEKLMQEQGGYENLMREQRRLMEGIEREQRRIMESEAVKQMEAEQQRMAEELSRKMQELQLKFKDDPQLLEMKMDSIAQLFESRNQAFEQQFEATFSDFEEKMRALENSPEMKALEEKMERMDDEMEQFMQEKIQPMEEEVESLQQALEERFEQQLQLLQEKMERLQQQYRKGHNKQEE